MSILLHFLLILISGFTGFGHNADNARSAPTAVHGPSYIAPLDTIEPTP